MNARRQPRHVRDAARPPRVLSVLAVVMAALAGVGAAALAEGWLS